MKVPASELAVAASPSGADADESPPARAGTGQAPPPSALQVALTELRRQLTAWMRHEPGARLGEDPEELHQLRVAVRRIEASLALFRHQLAPRLLQARSGAKSVLRILGATRDFDVQLAELGRYCDELPPTERMAAAPLRARLASDRASARARMIRALDSEATRHWLETVSLASADFTAANDPAAARAALVIPERVADRFRKLRKRVRGLDARSSMDDYHEVRRRAKQLRYALECSAGLLGKPAEEMLKALRRLQDRLGAHQDAHMAKRRLAAIVADPGTRLPAETLFLMGRLAEHHLHETAQVRRTLARSWRKVSGKRWKALRAKMQELSAQALHAIPAGSASPAAAEQPPPAASGEFPGPDAARTLKH